LSTLLRPRYRLDLSPSPTGQAAAHRAFQLAYTVSDAVYWR
jgi:hypothetical protein